MPAKPSNIEELLAYLKQAKANQWCLEVQDLSLTYQLTISEVKECIDKIFN